VSATARWVVFAYHTMGARCLAALLERGEDVAMVVTHTDDAIEGGWFESVASVARRYTVPVYTPATPNVPDVEAAIRAARPDIILSVWYRRLLGASLLGIPSIAALNLHGSLLPAYRGRAPLNWVLVNGESRTGVTLHHMTEEADAGDIVAQQPIDILPVDTAATLYARMVGAGVELLVRSYPAVVSGVAPRIPQDHRLATVFGRRRPEDGRVCWAWDAPRIVNMVRAVTHPFPGAFVGHGPDRLYLWAAQVDSTEQVADPPGSVLAVNPGRGVRVATGHGTVRLERVEDAGDGEEPGDQWARRRGLRPGMTLRDYRRGHGRS
jgi:methionyl-tRNA formyltransferase